jgi:hypothetical protein
MNIRNTDLKCAALPRIISRVSAKLKGKSFKGLPVFQGHAALEIYFMSGADNDFCVVFPTGRIF